MFIWDTHVRLALLLVLPLTLLIYRGVYGLDGFAHDRLVGHKTNVMGYPFLEGTRAMSLLRSCLFPFYSCIPTLVTTFSFKNSAHCTGA